MDIEEKTATAIKWTAERVWANFLHCGNSKTWFNVEINENSPSPEEQRRNIGKFEIRGGLKIIKRKGDDHFEIEVFPEEFKKILRQFANPRTAFNSYRLTALFPIKLPEGTRWEHIIIKFKNGHDVQITLKNKDDFEYIANYKEMGFQNSKKLLPNVQWKLLEALSKNNGAFSWDNPDASLLIKKRKQLLAQQLRDYFQLDDDPFEVYKREKEYKLKLTLLSQ